MYVKDMEGGPNMNRLNIANYIIYAIGGQLTYNNNIIIESKTIDKISRNR